MKDTLTFFNIAKPNPDKRDFFTQLSVHFEEFGETIEAIDCTDTDLYKHLKKAYMEIREDVPQASDEEIETLWNERINRTLLADSLADQYVTLIGTARAAGIDLEGCIKEVEASNLSKFIFVGASELTPQQLGEYAQLANDIEAQGRYTGVIWKRVGEYIVFYDDKGKIMKCPTTYFEPNLERFV